MPAFCLAPDPKPTPFSAQFRRRKIPQLALRIFLTCLLWAVFRLSQIPAAAAQTNLSTLPVSTAHPIFGKPQIASLENLTKKDIFQIASKLSKTSKYIDWKQGQFATFSLSKKQYSVFFLQLPIPRLLVDTDGDAILDSDYLPNTISENSLSEMAPAYRFEHLIFQLQGAQKFSYEAVVEIQPVTQWTLNGTKTQWQARLFSVGFRQGFLTFAGKKMFVGVQDNNSNGQFNDLFHFNPAESASAFGDSFFWDKNNDGDYQDEDEKLPLGRFVSWNGQLAVLNIAADGNRLNLDFYKGLTGILRVESEISGIAAVSNAGFLTAKSHDGQIVLPRGDYYVMKWIANRFAAGRNWSLQAAPPQPPILKIGPTPIENKFLAPLIANLQIERFHEKMMFNLSFSTTKGDVILLLQENGATPTLQLRISDAQDNPWARLKFSKRENASFEATWKVPATAPQHLKAQFELDCGPYSLETASEIPFSVTDEAAS